MKDFSIKLGFVPTRRLAFDKKEAQKHKNLIRDKLLSWKIDLVDIDWLNEDGMLYDLKDAEKVYKYFLEKDVDALFLPHCNFGTESAVAKLGKLMNKPLLLWGPRDDAPLGSSIRSRDTQCGLFATSKILRRFGVPFTYITNSGIEDSVFEKGFTNFLRAASVVKAFRNMRIGMISTRPGEFWSVMANEGELLEKFGIEVIPVALTEMIASAREYKDKNNEALKAVVKDIKGKNIDYSSIGEENLKKIVALKLAIKKWVEEEKLSAVAIQCWMALPDEYGIAPCFANAMLTDEKIPVVCETDIHGAITAVMLQAANMHKEPIFFADLTIRHPERNNSELLWHCGNFPYSLKAKDSPASVRWHGEVFPGIAHWKLKEGEVTVLRFDGDNGKYSLLMGHAHSVEGPQTSGTYLWVEVNDWPLWEERFIRGPYIHHVAGIYGKFAPVLYEACRYIPELRPDAVEPSEEELKKWLRE